ncbi:MAG TPA: gamma-glutamyl-gamma-aminobutyrate hydrolase family protein [Cellvibrionaceae bacterium]
MHIGILKTDHIYPSLAARHGEYPAMFMRLLRSVSPSLVFSIYDVVRGDMPGSLNDADAWLITGSKSGVYENKPWIGRLLQLTQALHEHRKPVIGICFGHQLLAQALGGRVEKSSHGWGVGVQEYTLAKAAHWMQPATPTLCLIASHQDQVIALPPGAQLLAGNTFCPNAMYTIGEHILGIQAHPEFSPAYARDLIEYRHDTIDIELVQQALDSLTTPTDNQLVARWLLAFTRKAAANV